MGEPYRAHALFGPSEQCAHGGRLQVQNRADLGITEAFRAQKDQPSLFAFKLAEYVPHPLPLLGLLHGLIRTFSAQMAPGQRQRLRRNRHRLN